MPWLNSKCDALTMQLELVHSNWNSLQFDDAFSIKKKKSQPNQNSSHYYRVVSAERRFPVAPDDWWTGIKVISRACNTWIKGNSEPVGCRFLLNGLDF